MKIKDWFENWGITGVAAVPGSASGGACVLLPATTCTMLISTTSTACVLPEVLKTGQVQAPGRRPGRGARDERKKAKEKVK